jgi:hypothetical protein
LVLAVVTLSMGSACAQELKSTAVEPIETKDSDPNVAKLTSDLASQLTFNGIQPAVAFVIDEKGNVTVLSKSTNPRSNVKFPRKKSEIEWTQEITVFKYSNPAICPIIGGWQGCY